MTTTTDILLGIFLNPWFVLSLIFWVIILVMVFLLRNKKEAVYVFFPLIAMIKTKKLNNFIMKLSKKAPRFWRIFWTIGIFVSFAFTILALFFFFINLVTLIVNPQIENAVTPLIPGVTVGLPLFMYLILPLLFIMTTHELAHGIAANVDGVEVKSTGILGAGLFYLIGTGAFVEVDERELNSPKHSRNTRLRIAAAGTYVNALTALVAFILLLNFATLVSPFYGAEVYQVDTVLTEEEGGFNFGKIEKGDVIVALKEKDSSKGYVKIDLSEGIGISEILDNKTDEITCNVGDKLTAKIYNTKTDDYTEKHIVLGPKYEIGFTWEYVSNDELKIAYVYAEKGDDYYDRNIQKDVIIKKINGTFINVKAGDTLEKILTEKGITRLKLYDNNGNAFHIDVELDGVRIGILSQIYWMPKNDVAKFFGGNTPDFILKELIWLWIIAFSITLFNMLPLPIFDGDRMVKEIVNSAVGDDYRTKKKKKERFYYNKDEKDYGLKEYRVTEIDSIKFSIPPNIKSGKPTEVILGEANYELIDKIGDGFKSTISFNLPEETTIKDKSIIEVEYGYIYDEKRPKKKRIINTIRYITLFIVLGNFIMSFVQLGAVTFWL